MTLSPERSGWVEKTLASLSLREKIGQTAQERMSGFPSREPAALQRYFEENPIGSLFCGGEIIKGSGASAEATRGNLRLCQKAGRIPLLIAGDLENGAGGAVRGMTVFPHMLALGAANDPRLAYEYGKYTALEGRAAGFNWTFAPVVDLLQNWQNPIVSNRCLGDAPDPVAALASAIIQGMQAHGMAACAKHFPGDGVDFRDQHLVVSVNSLSEEKWFESFGRVFEAVVRQGVYSVMTGHIALPWLEPMEKGQRRPRPATVSRKVITGLLRQRLGFDGLIVSDALEMAGFTGWAAYEQRIIEAFNAGNDVMLWPSAKYFDVMERALQDGRISPERLDESVRRVLMLKAALGLCGDVDAPESEETQTCAEVHSQDCGNGGSREIAREVAAKSVTLVRDDLGRLPLKRENLRRVLVHKAIGSTSPGRDSIDRLVELLKARGLALTVLENGNCLDVWNLEEKGERWDAYLVIFDLQIHQWKNTVRPVGPMAEVMWTLQNTATNKPIVVSLGSPFLLRDMPFLDALINCYSPSEASMEALDKALFGEIPFTSYSPVETGGSWY